MRDVVPIDRDEAALDDELRALGQRRYGSLIVERDVLLQRLPAHRAIHRAGVDVLEPENVGNGAGYGAFAGPGRAVYRYDDRFHAA